MPPPTLLAASLLAWALAPSAHAQIVADHTAPGNQRPTVLQTSDGKPLVNIQTPSEAGVSRNTYQQFDVQANGAVLNNQRGSNPWLAKGEAKVILNEVRSSNPSYLGGQLAVQGGRAEVIIANPSGINVDGASFSNVSRATLTTGTPVMDNGQLTGLKVERGTVNISSKGINTSGVSYTDVLARAVKISGKMQASANDTLSITTGTQTVGYADGLLEANAGTGAKPTVAIDTAALGGMYAGRILLLATEEGVGVRNAGTLQANASSGQLVVTADGRLENTGTMDAAITSVATLSGDLDNTGKLQGRQLIIAKSGNDLNLSGSGLVQGTAKPATVMLHAERDINVRANAAIKSLGSATTDGTTQRGQVALSAGRTLALQAGSQVQANGAVQLNSDGAMTLTQATLSSQAEDVVAISAGGITANKLQATAKTVHLETGAPFQETAADVRITGGSLKGSAQTNLIATGKLLIDGSGSTNNTPIDSQGGLHMQADKNLEVAAGTRIKAQGELTAQTAENLIMHGQELPTGTTASDIYGKKSVLLHGNGIRLHGSLVEAGQDLKISAQQNNIETYSLLDDGYHIHTELISEKDIYISAYDSDIIALGLHTKSENLKIVGTGNIDIKPSLLENEEPVSAKSQLQTDSDVILSSINKNITLVGTDILATGKIEIQAKNKITSHWADTIWQENFYEEENQFYLDYAYDATLGRSILRGSSVEAQAKEISLDVAEIEASSGDIKMIATENHLTISSSSQPGVPSALWARHGNILLHSAGYLGISDTYLGAKKDISLTSAKQNDLAIKTDNSRISTSGLLSISSAGSQHHHSSRAHAGALSFYADKGDLAFSKTTIGTYSTANSYLGLSTGQINIESGGSITIDVGVPIASASKFSAHTDLTIQAGTGDITLVPKGTNLSGTGLRLHASQLSAGRDLNIATRTGTLTLSGIAGNNGNASAKTVSLNTQGNLTLGGASVNIQGANLKSNGNLSITSYLGNLLIDGIKNNFSGYTPTTRVSDIEQRIRALDSLIPAHENDPDYQRLLEKVEAAIAVVNQHCENWPNPGPSCTEELLDTARVYFPLLDAHYYKGIALNDERDGLKATLPLLKRNNNGYEHLTANLSGHNITLTSAQGIAINGAQIIGTDKVNIQSAGLLPSDTTATTAEQRKPTGIKISGLSDFYESGSRGSDSHAWVVLSNPAYISGKNGVTMQAAGNDAQARLVLNDTQVQATSGTVHLQSRGDMRLEAGQEEFYSFSQRSYKTGKWYNRKRVTETHTMQETTASPADINGQNIVLKSGGSIHAEATAFAAPQGAITLTAANALSLYAVPEISFDKLDIQKKSSLFGISTGKSTSVTTREIASELPTKLVASIAQTNSGWDTLLQGTVFETLKGATINVSVGANARADAQIILQGIKRRVTETLTKEGNYVVWQRTLNAGSITETLAMPKFTGPVAPTFNGPVLADIPDGDFKTELTKLASQPGYEYLDVLAQRNDVNWQPVQLAFEQWHESQEGLTPAGAALLAVVVTAATHGTGAGWLGSAGSKTVIVNGVATTTFTTAGLMANAAIASLAAQASITLVNNHGDIGKTLKDLGKSDTARAALAAAITAGAMANVAGLDGMQNLANSADFHDKLIFNLIDSSGRALTDAAINGDDLGDAVRNGLIGGLVNTVHGEVAGRYIKKLETEFLLHNIAHALTGCAAGAAMGGHCEAGAVGAVIGELAAQLITPDPSLADSAEKIRTLAFSKLIAGGISAYIGSDVQTAIATADTAVRNNWLSSQQVSDWAEAMEQCKANATSCEDANNRYKQLSIAQQDHLESLCTYNYPECAAQYGHFMATTEELKIALEKARDKEISFEFAANLNFILMQQLEGESLALHAILSPHIQRELGVDAETADIITAIASASIGGRYSIHAKNKSISTSNAKEKGSYTPNAGSVGNMGVFLKSPGFGTELSTASQKTHKIYDGQTVYRANKTVGEYIRPGDQFYLDGEHMNHLEVFDRNNKVRYILNLDGSMNPSKTEVAIKQGRTLPKD